MAEFTKLNIVNFYSLVILAVIFFQSRHNLKYDNNKYNRMWMLCIAQVFVVQLIDIICWRLAGIPGNLNRIFSYALNCLLYICSAVLTAYAAAFAEYTMEFSEKALKFLFKIFFPLLILDILLVLLSIPFGLYFYLDEANDYFWGNFHLVSVILCFLPLFLVFLRVIIKYKGNTKLKLILFAGIVLPIAASLIKFYNLSEVHLSYPCVTLSIILFNILLLSNNMNIDYLTKLKNKRGLDKYFSRLNDSINEYIGLFYFDINAFKFINDTYGHKEGDIVLKSCARILTDTFRKGDLTARVGGDEFVAVTIQNSEKQIYSIKERFEKELDKFNAISSKPYILSISTGIVINSPYAAINPRQMLVEADGLMYKNKPKK